MSLGERERLEAIIRNGKNTANRLLKADISEAGEGCGDSRIVEALETSPAMVYRVRMPLVEQGFESVLAGKKREVSPTPPVFDGEKEARLIALSRAKPPAGHARWSLGLLENKVVELRRVDRASDSTIGRVLKKTSANPTATNSGSFRRKQTRPW